MLKIGDESTYNAIEVMKEYGVDLTKHRATNIRNSNIKFNHVALGAGLIHENSEIELKTIANAFNINESKVKKEIKNINNIKNPKSDKSKKFLDLIKK